IKRSLNPLVMGLQKLTGVNTKVKKSNQLVPPPQSIYDFEFVSNSGEPIRMDQYKGKKLLLVNTASDCIYTRQYELLQRLWDQNKDRLVVIGFPANDFGQQEQGNDVEIASFCSKNYGVTFPLAKKATVVRDSDQHPIYQWLTSKEKNGWNDQPPSWNFSQYLVNES